MFDFVATGWLRDADNSLSRLYWQQLFKAYHGRVAMGCNVITLYQSCESGGQVKWMNLPSFQKRYELHKWPICLMAACGDLQSAVGNFITIFFAHLKSEFDRQAARSVNAPTCSSPVSVLPVEWSCPACTFIQAWGNSHCDICGSDRPPPNLLAAAPSVTGEALTLEQFFAGVERDYWWAESEQRGSRE